MKLLLDTHIVLWTIDGSLGLRMPKLRRVFEDARTILHVSAASLWEINIKHGLGKLRIGMDLALLPDFLEQQGLVQIPISVQHVLGNADPEPPSRDPFDRLLLVQAQIEGMKLVTIDSLMTGHPVAFQT